MGNSQKPHLAFIVKMIQVIRPNLKSQIIFFKIVNDLKANLKYLKTQCK